MSFKAELIKRSIGAASVLAVVFPSALNWAQEQAAEGPIEEVIVTAQRISEDIQDVPIAVTAITDAMIEDQQVITPSDLQLNAPGITYTATNFGGSSFSIRGVGSLAIGSASIGGVSVHTNEISLPSNLNSVEFFDMERLEILRGPQGTLFGRNATGGAINFITKKPSYDEFSSHIDLEQGNYNHFRLKGNVNLPITDSAGLRFAGFKLTRDGYTENTAFGQTSPSGETLPMITETMDGRDLFAVRGTLSIDLTDDMSLWVMYSHFEEDSDRARIINQVCDRNSLPTTGCRPNNFGLENPHLGATTAGIFAGLQGSIPLGASGAGNSLFDYPRNPLTSLRQIHTDFQPVFQEKEQILSFGLNHSVGDLFMSLIGGVRESDYLSRQDYIMDVGPELSPIPQNPLGLWPVSAPAGAVSDDWRDEGCSLVRGTAGAWGGCTLEGYDTSRQFAYDQSSNVNYDHTLEAKVHSEYDSTFNFLLGVSTSKTRRSTEYFVIANTLDSVTQYGLPALGLPPLYPGFFLNASAPDGLLRDNLSAFGEGYFDLSDRMKLTVGARVNRDSSERMDSSTLFNAQNHAGIVLGVQSAILAIAQAQAAALGIPPELVTLDAAIAGAVQGGLLDANYLDNINIYSGAFWSRTLNILLGPFASGAPETALTSLYGVNQAELDAALRTPAYSAARVAISKQIPIVPMFNESRHLTGSPSSAEFTELSGRIGVDYQVDNNTLWYGFASKGYKPGGLNPAIPRDFQDTTSFTFEPESVYAFEVGRKARVPEKRLLLNTAAFLYDYTGLQATVIKQNSSITENVDATILGLEAEGNYTFEAFPSLSLDFSYGFLKTRINESESIDTSNRTAGEEGWVLLNNIDPGALTGVNYIAREAHLVQGIVDLALINGAALDVRNGTTVVPTSYPMNSGGVSIPAYMSRNFLTAVGVETSDGIPTDLDGKTLPYSPEHTFKVGVAHTTTDIWGGNLTFRWDLYWQSSAYSRAYNTVGDEIDSWSQHNVSAIFESANDAYSIRLWMRNVMDKENVTGHYLTTDTSGFFRNYFLTEPRIGGISIGVNL